MKTRNIFVLASFLVFAAFTFESCKKDSEDTQQEYIADDNSFKNFSSWTLEATSQGPDPTLGTAHGGNDSTVVRSIYFKNGQDPVDGKYPVGTLIAKYSKNPNGTVNAVTGLAKRGNNFNPSAGDWEWFVLNTDGTIAEDGDGNPIRGANIFNGACVACHTQASSKDYVFSK